MNTLKQGRKSLTGLNLKKSFEDIILLKDVSVSINPGEKIGLVGRNGCGKSTLFKILSGFLKADHGQVHMHDLKIGYLYQDLSLDAEKTIWETAVSGVLDLISLLEKYDAMNAAYQPDDTDFISEYDALLQQLESKNAFGLEDRVHRILENIGLTYDVDRPVSNLSGGEIVKLALGKLLISDPDILLLDEPTNHIDLRANFWLREFVRKFDGGVLLVSHNRDFLNEVADTIWELEDGEIRVFGGNYDFYKEQIRLEEEAREREVTQLIQSARKARKKIQKEQQRSAHSDRKDLNKNPDDNDKSRAKGMKEAASKFQGKQSKYFRGRREAVDSQLKAVRGTRKATLSPVIDHTNSHKGKRLIRIEQVCFGYATKQIVKDVNLEIHYGDRISIFGENGSGKTTLIKGLLAIDPVIVEGDVTRSDDLQIQYLDQTYSLVNRNLSVLDNLVKTAPHMPMPDIRQHLAKFLFMDSDHVIKPASALSGGEIARLALALLTVSPMDILIMDEPTNNLDLVSIEEIENVLQDFPGTLIVISHDLAFQRNICCDQAYMIHAGSFMRMKYEPREIEAFKQELLTFI